MNASFALPLREYGPCRDRGERIVIVSGGRGAGKTTFCRALAEAVQGTGLVVAGLVSPAVFAGGSKLAIDLHDLASGETRRLAERPRPGTPGTAGLGWRFAAETLAWGNRLLRAGEASDLLVIDELGPLEFRGHGGLLEGFAAIERGRFRQAVVVVRPELIAAALARWPAAAVIEPPATAGRAHPPATERSA